MKWFHDYVYCNLPSSLKIQRYYVRHLAYYYCMIVYSFIKKKSSFQSYFPPLLLNDCFLFIKKKSSFPSYFPLFSFFGRVAWLCKNWPKHVLIAAESLNYSWSLKSYLQNSFSTWCMSSSTCTYGDFLIWFIYLS